MKQQPTKQRKDVKYRPLHKGLRCIDNKVNKNFSFSHGFTSRIFVKSDVEPDSNAPLINCFALDSRQASDSTQPASKTDSSGDSRMENPSQRAQRSSRSRAFLPSAVSSPSSNSEANYLSGTSTPASASEHPTPIDGSPALFGYPQNGLLQPNYHNTLIDPFFQQYTTLPIQHDNGLGMIGNYDPDGWPTLSQSELDLAFQNTLSELGEDSAWMFRSKRDPSPRDFYDTRHYPALLPSQNIESPFVLGANNSNSVGTSSLPYHSGPLDTFPFYEQPQDHYQSNFLYDTSSYTNTADPVNMQQYYGNDSQFTLGPDGYPVPFDTPAPLSQGYYPAITAQDPQSQPALSDQIYLAERQYTAELFKTDEY